MIIVIGFIVVIASVLGGFIMGGGSVAALVHPNELIIIAGGALGAMVVMAPKKVLKDLVAGLITCLKGSPHSRAAYDELLKVLYELFLLGRRNGMIALEEHVMEPKNSQIFKKYPLFSGNLHAVEFLCGSLRPIIDGKIKPDQLRLLLDVEINRMEDDHHAPVNVLTKTGDAMPGFWHRGRGARHRHHDGVHFRTGGKNRRTCRRRARWNIFGHSYCLRFYQSAGHEPGIRRGRRTGLHPLHRGVRDWFRRRHGARNSR